MDWEIENIEGSLKPTPANIKAGAQMSSPWATIAQKHGEYQHDYFNSEKPIQNPPGTVETWELLAAIVAECWESGRIVPIIQFKKMCQINKHNQD